jgi:hypothetical protein
MPKVEPELTEIARQLDIDIRTLRKWRQRDTFPHGAGVAEVKAWADSQGLHRTYSKGDASELTALKAESLKRDIEIKDQKLAAMRGELVDREVMRAMLRTLGQKWDLLLRLKLEVELGPRVVGKSAAEANVEGSRILDEIREVVNANLARFEPDVVKQSKSSAGSVEA